MKQDRHFILKGYFDGSFLNFDQISKDASMYLFLLDPSVTRMKRELIYRSNDRILQAELVRRIKTGDDNGSTRVPTRAESRVVFDYPSYLQDDLEEERLHNSD